MEEIFVNPGLQLVLEKICYFLSPKSFQSLTLTSKFMMSFSANVSEKWFLKCQKAKLITDVNKWTLLLKIAQEHRIEWNLGIIFKFIYYYRNSVSSSIFHEIKEVLMHNLPFRSINSLSIIIHMQIKNIYLD